MVFPTRVRLLFVTLWLLLLGEAVLMSPTARPDQTEWMIRLATGSWSGEEPLVVALFQLMGIWPLAMAALLAPVLRNERVPLWPFALASMALGAFVLLPGLVLAGPPRPAAPWQGWLGSRLLAGILLVPTVLLMGWGLVAGSPAAFLEAWRTEQFVHVMALDFVVLWITSMVVARWIGTRWGLTAIPLVGVWVQRLAHEGGNDG